MMINMLNKNIQATSKTPEVNLDPSGNIVIIGKSIPENPEIFYSQISDWIIEYNLNPAKITKVDILFDVINADSCPYIIQILSNLVKKSKPPELIINWHYDIDDPFMLETGKNIASALNVQINFILKKKMTNPERFDNMKIIPQKTSGKLKITKKTLLMALISLLLILILAFLAVTISEQNQRYNAYIGDWAIKAPASDLGGFIIKNISIIKSEKLFLVYAKGDIDGYQWGPLLFVAQPNKGIMEIEPCKFYGSRRSEIYNSLLTQPFKIYYSAEYDRIIVGNVFFAKSKEKVWNF